MAFVRAWSKVTGFEQMVPEHFFDNPALCRGLTRENPDGEQVVEPQVTESDVPSEDWTVDRLKAYAADETRQYDLAGATRKADILAAVRAADEAAKPDNPALNAIGVANPVPDPGDNNPQTPATGENQE